LEGNRGRRAGQICAAENTGRGERGETPPRVTRKELKEKGRREVPTI